MSCLRTQHSDACGNRTQDLSIRNPMLYHYATALPCTTIQSNLQLKDYIQDFRCINHIFYAYYTWLETENRSDVSITSSMPIIHGWKQKTGHVYQSHPLCLLYMAGNRKQVMCINHILYAYYTWLETENRSGVSITSSMPKIAYYTWLETENRSDVSITSSMPIIHGWKQKTGHVYQSHPLCLLYMAGNRKQVRCINHIVYA